MVDRSSLLALLLITACRDDSSAGAGEETGPCVQGYCVGELQCVRDRCVDPDQAATDDADASAAQTSEGSDDDSSTPSDSGDGDPMPTDEPWCEVVGDDQCACSLSDGFGAPNVACGPSVVGSPSLCCAQAGWPSPDTTCSCNTLRCHSDGSSCWCGPSQGTTTPEVETCEPEPGGVCCLDDSSLVCRCVPTGDCGDLGTLIPSCTIDVVGCYPGHQEQGACAD